MRQAFAAESSDLVKLFKQAASEGRIVLMPTDGNAEPALIITCATVFGLRPAEARALAKLVKQDHVTRQEMHIALSPGGNPVSDPKGINVTICGLRKRLKPHGIEIVTRCKLGHQLTEDSKVKVRERLAAYGADVVAAATPPTSDAPLRLKKTKAA